MLFCADAARITARISNTSTHLVKTRQLLVEAFACSELSPRLVVGLSVRDQDASNGAVLRQGQQPQ